MKAGEGNFKNFEIQGTKGRRQESFRNQNGKKAVQAHKKKTKRNRVNEDGDSPRGSKEKES